MTRGQIVQRVMVDGWSIAETAAVFDVGERQVIRWVAAYRRHGMASLRGAAVAERAPRRWLWHLSTILAPLRAAIGVAEEAIPGRCVTLRRADDKRPTSRKSL